MWDVRRGKWEQLSEDKMLTQQNFYQYNYKGQQLSKLSLTVK